MIHDTLPTLFPSSRRYSPDPVEKIPIIQVEGKRVLDHTVRSAFQERWLESADFLAETACYWGAYRELVPRIDVLEETTKIQVDITCTVRGNTDAREYKLLVDTYAIEPIRFGRRLGTMGLGGEKEFPISIGEPSYQEKVVAFLQARIYAFAWLRAVRAHFHRLFQMSTLEEVLMYQSLLRLEQTEEFPPARSPLTLNEYALLCRWVEPYLVDGQLFPLTQKAEQTINLLQGKDLVKQFVGEYHTVEYAQGRVQRQKAESAAHLTLPENFPGCDEAKAANTQEKNFKSEEEIYS